MTHYQKCKAHRPDRAYKSKTTSTIMREWLEWYVRRMPVCYDAALGYIYHQLLPAHEEYRGPHNHQIRARIMENVRRRIFNECWFVNQHLQIHEVHYHVSLMNIDKFMTLAADALNQPKDRCNDEPLTGA